MLSANEYKKYAAKMRQFVLGDTDLEVDVRFLDMLLPRRSKVLDVGCGIGNAVSGLRARGHEAFGIDPAPQVLKVAAELYDEKWFRCLASSDISANEFLSAGLPTQFDAVLLSGNVPAFLSTTELSSTFYAVRNVLAPDGILVLGTTSAAQGGPADQDIAASCHGFHLLHRYSNWHLKPFTDDSPWSVSVFSTASSREFAEGPDGIFILPSQK